ncbi:MAG TPA: hypothetical protein PKV33_03375 [Methanothrix sp.]|nr:hypothetical protein [Methanothrix sp.]
MRKYDDDNNEANEDDDEPENSLPGFELPAAGAAATVAAWFIGSRLA